MNLALRIAKFLYVMMKMSTGSVFDKRYHENLTMKIRHPAITCRACFTLKSEESIQRNIAQESCRERVDSRCRFRDMI